MTLNDFVATLPTDIQEKVSGFKPLGVIRILQREGIEIPPEILDDFNKRRQRAHDHECIMDSMRPFL